ncbi:hypothetical protein T484DRAFT_1955727, partial [Baffinella frigidus]
MLRGQHCHPPPTSQHCHPRTPQPPRMSIAARRGVPGGTAAVPLGVGTRSKCGGLGPG